MKKRKSKSKKLQTIVDALTAPRKPRGRNLNPPPPPVAHQFKPGVSGNPSGRPKNRAGAISDWIERPMTPAKCRQLKLPEGTSCFEGIMTALTDAATNGNVEAARALLPELRNNSNVNVGVGVQTIDYNAGKTAKDILMEKLGGEYDFGDTPTTQGEGNKDGGDKDSEQ